MISAEKTIETKIARLNTSFIDSGAYVRKVVIESTSMRKSFF